MDRVLSEIRKIIDECMTQYLPNVKINDLEDEGAVFYMNAQNGTEFDWFVNDRLPFFMIFYNDEDNLGSAKLALNSNGEVQLFLYDEKGKKLARSITKHPDIDTKNIIKLAAILTREADDKRIWNSNIENINTDINITDYGINEFAGRQKNYAVMKNRMNICNMYAVVSKRITDEGWKVGYMERYEPHSKDDSGWFFAAGSEDDEYLSSPENLTLVMVGVVWQKLDKDIFKYIDMPAGTKLIRISPDEFEKDKNDKEIYMVKREE